MTAQKRGDDVDGLPGVGSPRHPDFALRIEETTEQDGAGIALGLGFSLQRRDNVLESITHEHKLVPPAAILEILEHAEHRCENGAQCGDDTCDFRDIHGASGLRAELPREDLTTLALGAGSMAGVNRALGAAVGPGTQGGPKRWSAGRR